MGPVLPLVYHGVVRCYPVFTKDCDSGADTWEILTTSGYFGRLVCWKQPGLCGILSLRVDHNNDLGADMRLNRDFNHT